MASDRPVLFSSGLVQTGARPLSQARKLEDDQFFFCPYFGSGFICQAQNKVHHRPTFPCQSTAIPGPVLPSFGLSWNIEKPATLILMNFIVNFYFGVSGLLAYTDLMDSKMTEGLCYFAACGGLSAPPVTLAARQSSIPLSLRDSWVFFHQPALCVLLLNGTYGFLYISVFIFKHKSCFQVTKF